jgi:hypothetical protein
MSLPIDRHRAKGMDKGRGICNKAVAINGMISAKLEAS